MGAVMNDEWPGGVVQASVGAGRWVAEDRGIGKEPSRVVVPDPVPPTPTSP
jgi:hypothetical protein